MILIGAALASAVPCLARTKLVTLPGREAMLVNIEHPERNLVMEERTITLEKGLTTIAFSWQGVQIDPSSIQLQPMEHPDTVTLISVSYPPNENALEWLVSCPEAGQERFRIYYLLGGVERQVEYRLDVAADEQSAVLRAYYRLGNMSGEDFDETVLYTGIGRGVEKSIESGARLQLLAARFAPVSIAKVYRFKPFERPEVVGWYYEILNSAERGLGEYRLPAGKVRVYMQSTAGDDVFLGEDYLDALAVREKDDLYLGDARDVTAAHKQMDVERQNLRRAGSARQIVMWDEVIRIQYELQNFKDEPITLLIEEVTSDNWDVEELTQGADWKRKHNGLLEISVPLPPKSDKLVFDLTIRKTNQTQIKF
ncbi:MAG: hypothetical protein Kow0059_13400 [Candidatus Sumerlaeia bacterium]